MSFKKAWAGLVKKEILDELLGGSTGKDPFGNDGLIDELRKALAKRALNAEMDHHLANEAEDGRTNRRNSYSKKSVRPFSAIGSRSVAVDLWPAPRAERRLVEAVAAFFVRRALL
jgi:hypothetical protein